MISRQSFKMLMHTLKQQIEFDDKVGRTISSVGDPEFNEHGFIITSPAVAGIIAALNAEFGDKYNNISYFIYDTDWGKKADDYNITLADGRVIKFYDAGYVYDYLVEEANREQAN